jgi:hypothetical protein
MLRTIIAALILIAPSAVANAASCSGAHAVITSVSVKNVESAGGLNTYHITGTVVNDGSEGQASNVLQSVDIYQGVEKKDTKSIPPLAAGQSYTFDYVAQRSADAGNGTTKMKFQMDPASGTCGSDSTQYAMSY